MNQINNKKLTQSTLLLTVLFSFMGCGNKDDSSSLVTQKMPQLSPAIGLTLNGTCSSLIDFQYDKTVISTATLQEAGELSVANQPIAAHCLVTGYMHPRTSPIDGQHYQIGFEMRLPLDWNGRFLYQGNGGTDGNIAQAVGSVGSGGPLTNALYQGFAVISSDAGHSAQQNPTFGMDPQARIDYGYGAITKLTPMAKNLIKLAYGKTPDRSYAGGTSNGGRHAMIAATRLANEYDGILASTPGFHLPRAAVAQLYTAQQLRTIATDENDLSTAFTFSERQTVANSILERCDHLDGIVDGMVQDIEACRSAFKLNQHVPICQNERTGTCLTPAQIQAISNIFTGPINSKGEALYATQPYDPGLIGSNWASWKFESSVGTARDPVAVGIIFQIPPDLNVVKSSKQFAFNFNFDTDYPKLSAINETYQESAMSFMLPPNELNLDQLLLRGGKMLIVQGTADGVFSVDDTQHWYDQLIKSYEKNAIAKAPEFVKFFRIPGMNHSSGGIATDQFDALTTLVRWVEYGEKPEYIIASARGPGNLSGKINTELPSDWSADRTRPLCAYPLIARYKGRGDSEKAENFSCS